MQSVEESLRRPCRPLRPDVLAKLEFRTCRICSEYEATTVGEMMHGGQGGTSAAVVYFGKPPSGNQPLRQAAPQARVSRTSILGRGRALGKIASTPKISQAQMLQAQQAPTQALELDSQLIAGAASD
jgi:hypothetical protein